MELTGQAIRSQAFGAKVRGYDPGEVDNFLESIAEQIDVLNTMPPGGPREAEVLRIGSQIRSVTFGARVRGYDPTEVDALLEAVANSLSDGSGHFEAPTPSPTSGQSSMSPAVMAMAFLIVIGLVALALAG